MHIVSHSGCIKSVNVKDNDDYPLPAFPRQERDASFKSGTEDCFHNELESNILITLSRKQSNVVQSLECAC